MADTVITIGGDIRDLQQKLRQGEREVSAFGSRVQKAGAKSNAGMYGIGGAANQFADIAVQLEMGTKFTRVMGQQLPQILGAFGPAGMIAGGVAAVGLGLYNAGEAASEAFGKMMAGAEGTAKSVQKLLGNGGVGEMAAATQDIAEQMGAINRETESLTTMWGSLKTLLGGDTAQNRLEQLAEAQSKLSMASLMAGAQASNSAREETAIMELRLQGREAEADEMERHLKLAKEFSRIDAMPFGDNTKSNLKAEAERQSLIEKQMRDGAKLQRGAEAVMDSDVSLKIVKLRAEGRAEEADEMERQLRLAQELAKIQATSLPAADKDKLSKLARLKSELDAELKIKTAADEAAATRAKQGKAELDRVAKLKQEIADIEISQLSPEAQIKALASEAEKLKRLAGGEQGPMQESARLEALKQIAQIEAQIAGIKEQQTADQTAEAEKASNKQDALTQLKEELRILEAKAAGQDKVAEKLEREKRIREETKRIEESTGLDPAAARSAAEQKVNLEDQIRQQQDDEVDGGRQKIRGANAAKRNAAMAKWRSGGLDAFYARQGPNGPQPFEPIVQKNEEQARNAGKDDGKLETLLERIAENTGALTDLD